MRIELRSAWNARPPKSVARIGPTGLLFLHHSVTGTTPPAAILRSIQNYHMDSRGWQDIAYSFLASTDGRAWTGRGAYVAGGHTQGYNTSSHAVCAIGNFEDHPPPAALIEGLAQLAAHGYRQGWWTCRGYTGGHRDVAQTSCPGRHLYAQIPAINRRTNEILTGKPKKGGLTVSEAAKIRKEINKKNKAQNKIIKELGARIRDLQKADKAYVDRKNKIQNELIKGLGVKLDDIGERLDKLERDR